MLKSVLGAISSDLAIDIGSTSTRIATPSRGVICHEPSLVAVHEDRRGGRRILAVGSEAEPMIGRAPPDVRVICPVEAGSITDFEVMEAMLRFLMVQVHGRRLWVGPRVAISIPYGTTDMERRAVRESLEASGAREVLLVEQPLAAGLGAGLPVHEACGQMIADVGGGITEISVLSLGGVVYSRVVPVGGSTMDQAIVDHVRDQFGLLISPEMAASVRHELGSVMPSGSDACVVVKGRHLASGYPRWAELTADEVRAALQGTVHEIARAIISSLERTPPDLASDVAETGLVLTGGCANLTGLDRALGDATGLPVVIPENPSCSVVMGACRVLEDRELRRAAS